LVKVNLLAQEITDKNGKSLFLTLARVDCLAREIDDNNDSSEITDSKKLI